MIPNIDKNKIKNLRRKLINFIISEPRFYKELFLKEKKIQKKKIKKDLLSLLKNLNLVRVEEGFIIPNVRINYIKNKILICTDLCSYKKEDQVFPIHAEQLFLIDNLDLSQADEVLELGVGSGIISIFAALKTKKVHGAEINGRAIKFAKFNCILNNVEDRIKIIKSNWFSEFKGMKFDAIFSNPPFEPTPRGLKHFYHSAAGKDGLGAIRKFLHEFKKYLKPKGRFLLVTYSISSQELLLSKLVKKINGRKEIIVLPQSIPLLEFMEKYPLSKGQKEYYKKKKIYLVVLNVYPDESNKFIIKILLEKEAKKYGNILYPLGMQERGVEIVLDLGLMKKIQKIQADIKTKSPTALPLKEIPWSDIAQTKINNKPSKRLMVVAVAKGCAWAKGGSGPCTMCNFWYVCSEKASDKQRVDLFKQEIKKYNFEKQGIEEIDIFNAGSFLNDKEMPRNVRKEIIKIINKIKPIKKVLIESRPEYITKETLSELKKILGNKKLEVGIGLESANDFIREVCINKGFNKKSFEKAVKNIKKARCSFFAYALVKPPFLTEKESIDDAVKTAKYIFNIGKKFGVETKVALEPVFIKSNTLVYKLFKNNLYSHVWLWSIIEILKKISYLGDIQVGISPEGMEWNTMPKNCKRCTKEVLNLIAKYNETQNIDVLKNFTCSCKEKWGKEQNKREIPLKQRVSNYFKINS